MSVHTIRQRYINELEQPPLDTPVPIVNGQVLFSNSKPWSDWFMSVSDVGRAVCVNAAVDFGTISAQSFRTELIQYSTDLFNSMDDYIVVLRPDNGGSLIFFARQVLASKLQVYCVNYTASAAVLGELEMEFLIIPKRG